MNIHIMREMTGRLNNTNLWVNRLVLLGVVFWCAIFLSLPVHASEDGFLDPEKAFIMQVEMVAPDIVRVRFKIATDYYMYRERFSFKIDSKQVELGSPQFQPGKVKFDPTFNKEMELYFNEAVITLPLKLITVQQLPAQQSSGQQTPSQALSTTTAPITLTVNGQGCATAGLCYPPMDFTAQLVPAADGKGFVVLGQASLLSRLIAGQWREILFDGNDEGLAGLLSASGLLEITLLFFVLGALLALTPCVLPMVPILSVLLVGEQHHVSRSKGFMLAAAYVAGMSVIYTLLGIAAGLSGAGLAAWLQTPWVLAGFSILLALLALAMFDVYQFQMPSSIQTRLTVTNSHILGGRMSAAALMGALSALIVGPCVAAPLAGALLYISQTGDVVLGGMALFAMAWGMGLPLLAMGASAGKLMPRTGAWMEGVKKFFGMLLFATAWWMVMPALPTWVQILGWAVLAMLAAMLLRTFEPSPENAGFAGVLRKTLGMLLVLLSMVWVLGVASGGRSLLQPLSHLAVLSNVQPAAQLPTTVTTNKPQSFSTKQLLGVNPNTTPSDEPKFLRIKTLAELDALIAKSDKPVMLDFYADWCVSCKEMEAFTFTDPLVAKKMSQMLLLQADVTANNESDRALLKRFRLFGPPGIIFFQAGGAERRDIRVVGYQDAARFASTLDRMFK
jgi:thiol:disulfide interchange protein DsbD